MTPREIVSRCLKFQTPPRIPRDLWLLPWATQHYPVQVGDIQRRFPPDFVNAPDVYAPSPRRQGDQYGAGSYTDEWGCTFENVQPGVIGIVRTPQVKTLADWQRVRPPFEILPDNPAQARDDVNRFCSETDRFVLALCCPRPWERYQFLRGTENALMDVMGPEPGFAELLDVIHRFYLKELEFWVATDVDGIMFMDDWGAQDRLLITPALWRNWFKPRYRDYCALAHTRGKFALMHSDGNITAIYPDLIEVGVDAVNSQLSCMDLTEIARLAKGRITFWGEIDRQQVLPADDPEVGRAAVRRVAERLYDPKGGIIAQLEFGLNANPDVVSAVYEEWARIGARNRDAGTS